MLERVFKMLTYYIYAPLLKTLSALLSSLIQSFNKSFLGGLVQFGLTKCKTYVRWLIFNTLI
jgi:hypothetical protein